MVRTSLRFCAAYSVFLGAIELLATQSGLLHVALTPTVAWLFVIASAVLAFAFDRWLVRHCPLPSRPVFQLGAREEKQRRWWFLAGLAAFAYAVLWIPAWCRMDMSWDGMSYHIPTIAQWAVKGYIHWLVPPPESGEVWQYDYRAVYNGYPKGVETMAFVLARISHDKLLNAPNMVFFPLAFGASTLVARELGAPRAIAAAIALLFVTVPTNVGQAAATYVDTSFSSAVMCSLALGFVIVRGLLAGRVPPWPLVVGTGAAMGLALGTKAPGTAYFAMLWMVMAGTALVRFRRRRERSKRLVASLATMLVIGFSIGGIWYFRNWYYAGNPLNPIEVRIAGVQLFKGDDLGEQIGERFQTPTHVATWPMPAKIAYTWLQSGQIEWPIDGAHEHDERGYMLPIKEDADPVWPRSIRGYDPRTGGLGFLWVAACVPSLIFLAIHLGRRFRAARKSGSKKDRVRAARTLALGILWMLPIIGLFKLVPMPWWARYTLWLYGLGLPALAFAHTVIQQLPNRVVARALQGAFALLMCVSFFEYGYSAKWSVTRDHFMGPAHVASLGDLWRGITSTN